MNLIQKRIEADIIVYNNDDHSSAHIVVECKKQDVSDMEFKKAIAQAFSYAATGTVRAMYFWVTSKIKDAYFKIPEKELQDSIKADNDYLNQLEKIAQEKKQDIKTLQGFNNPEELEGKALIQSEAHKEWDLYT